MDDIELPPKRRRIERTEEEPVFKLDDAANDDYVPYVPVAQRRQAKLSKLATRGLAAPSANGGDGSGGDEERDLEREEREAREDVEREEERRRERARKERTLLEEAQDVMKQKEQEGMRILNSLVLNTVPFI